METAPNFRPDSPLETLPDEVLLDAEILPLPPLFAPGVTLFFETITEDDSFDPLELSRLLETAEQKEDAPEQIDDPSLRLSPEDILAFKVQMRQCWSVPAGAAHAHKLIVKIRIILDPEGRLLTPPLILNRPKPSPEQRFFRVAAESALRAIQRCQPFQMPEEKYEEWKELNLTFNPSEMLGG